MQKSVWLTRRVASFWLFGKRMSLARTLARTLFLSLSLCLWWAKGPTHLSARNGRKMFDALTAAAATAPAKLLGVGDGERQRCQKSNGPKSAARRCDAFSASTQNVRFNGTFSLWQRLTPPPSSPSLVPLPGTIPNEDNVNIMFIIMTITVTMTMALAMMMTLMMTLTVLRAHLFLAKGVGKGREVTVKHVAADAQLDLGQH